MANMKYFNSDSLLINVHQNKAGQMIGLPEGVTPIYTKEDGWYGQYVRADRKVEYKSNPSRHECDARCINATGLVMKCECSCGGKNHGRGSSFACEAACGA